jgi:hypothetical protein
VSSSSQQLPTPSSSSNGSRAAHSYVSVPRGSRRTVVRYDEPVLPPHPRAPLASHSEQKPLAFAWGPSAAAMYHHHHRPLSSQNSVSATTFERDQHKFYYSRQGSVSAGASPASASSDSFSGYDDDDDEEDDDEDDAMMAVDPTPTASSFNLSPVNRNPKDDMVFQSYLPLPSSSLSHSSSASTPTSALSPITSSNPPPAAQSIPDLNFQLAPFANAGPAGVHHWTTTSAIAISPQSQTRAPHHHQYSPPVQAQQQYQHYNSRPNANNTSTGSSPLAPIWNRSQHPPSSSQQQQWSPTAVPYGAPPLPPMGVWSEAPSPVGRGRRM